MKKINYNIEDFNIISNYIFPINIYVDILFGKDKKFFIRFELTNIIFGSDLNVFNQLQMSNFSKRIETYYS
jgi:hypothetical protein